MLSGMLSVWDCLFNTGYPGFGVPVPLFIGCLISNLILLKTIVLPSRTQIKKRPIHVILPEIASFERKNKGVGTRVKELRKALFMRGKQNKKN